MPRTLRFSALAASISLTLGLLALTPYLARAEQEEAPSIFADAVAYWPMTGLEDANGGESELAATEGVELNEGLKGSGYAASLTQNGDGFAAQLGGGQLSVGGGEGDELNITGDEFTFAIRLQMPAEDYRGMIASKHAGDQFLFELYITEYAERPYLEALVAVDGLDSPLKLRVPTEWLGPFAWKTIVITCDEAKVKLFVEGVWQDEDFVLGKPRANAAAPLVIGNAEADLDIQVDYAALWDRRLTEEEVVALNGGVDHVAMRREQMIEPSDTPLQYWNPRHEDWNVGDCLPFYHDGVYHFLYLADKRHHGSKGGLGAHQWAHATSTDLVHWEHHEMAVPVSQQWEGSICTGSMFWHDGVYYAYYATRMSDRSGEYVSVATSTDGIHFEKQEPNPLAGPEPPYRTGPFRDPHVFQDPETGLFHMLVTAALEEPELMHRGDCLAHLVSEDLVTWEQQEPFFEPGLMGAPECMEVFKWNDWWYLISSNHGTARYRMARSPMGPWEKPRVDTLGGPTEWVLKSAEYHDNRRIGVAWIGEGGWAGHTVFRELIQFEDGTLGTKFPEEMQLPAGESITAEMEFATLSGQATREGDTVHIDSPGGFAVAALDTMPHNCRISMTISSATPNAEFGICARGTDNYAEGNEIRFVPAEQKVGLREALSGPRDDRDDRTIYGVDGLEEPFTFEIVLKDDLIDICVDGRRTMINRTGQQGGERLFFFALHGDVTFSDIEVRPLLESRE